MLAFVLPLMAAASLLLDLSILRRIGRRYPDRKWLRRLYLVHFILIDAAVAGVLIFYGKLSNAAPTEAMRTALWVIWVFFATAAPKAVFLLSSLFDRRSGKADGQKTTLFSRIGLAAAAATLALMLWGATAGRTHIVTERLTLESDRLPESFDGYKIVFFTDLHTGNLPGNHRLIRRMAERIDREHADMVVNGGDLVNIDARELTPEIMGLLSTIRAADGVYSVLGNHDLGFYIRENRPYTPRQSVGELLEKQKAMGWTPLVDESGHIRRGGDSISVTGFNFPEKGSHRGRRAELAGCDMEKAYASAADGTFNLLISHTPEFWDDALETGGPDLTLSGHVHAMQFKIPFGKRGWSPASWMYDRWSGLYAQAGKYLYVNDGMGYVMYPMRIGAPPSITVITLKRKG